MGLLCGGWRARSAKATPNYRATLVNGSYLVSLFCRQGKPSHSHCKDPAQISRCENQSEASLARSHWLQTQKVTVMFKHAQRQHILTHPAWPGLKRTTKNRSQKPTYSISDIFLTIAFKCGPNEFYTLNAGDLTRGVQLVARGPHAAQDRCECGPTQNRKFT